MSLSGFNALIGIRYYQGSTYIDVMPGSKTIASNDKYIVRYNDSKDFIFQVIDTSNKIIFELKILTN